MKSRLKKNFLYLSIYKVLELFIPMLISPILSRTLGAQSIGLYSYSYSIVCFFAILAELGCYRYGIREIAKVRDNKEKLEQTYSDIFCVHMFNGVIIFIIYFLFNYLIDQLTTLNCILSLFLISNMIDNFYFYVGIEKVGPMTIRDSAIKIITFALIIALIKNPNDVYVYAIIMSVSAIICKLISLIYSFKFVKFVKPNIHNCMKHYKPMAFLMIPALASVAYQSMDKIMIGLFFDKAEVGFYECASKALIPKNIIAALGTVFCPGIANLYVKKRVGDINMLIKKSFLISMILSYSFMFGICGVAKDFAPWFWGENFAVCSKLIIGLSITIPIWTIGEVIRNQYLLPVGKDSEYTYAFLTGVIVNCIINIILIPKYGAHGAIIATIVAELVMSVIHIFMVNKDIYILKYLIQSLPYFISGIIMMLCIRTFSNLFVVEIQGIKILFEVIIGALLYLILAVAYEKISHNYILLDVVKKEGSNKI